MYTTNLYIIPMLFKPWVGVMTEGKGFCLRRQEKKAETQLREDLQNLDKIVVIENKKRI
jgi:hypothetical protein